METLDLNFAEVTDNDGTVVRLSREVRSVDGDTVSFSHIFTSPSWDEPQTSRSTLRFLCAERLSAFLSEAGLEVESQFGDWDGSAFVPSSPEIVTFVKPGEAG
jgi:hypothetical protein